MPAKRTPRSILVLLTLIGLAVLGLAVTGFAAGPVLAQETIGPWQGAEERLPFQNAEEVLAFLVHAEVVDQKELNSGSTRPFKLTLERNGVRAHAIFRTVDAEVGRDFRKVRDHYRHEVAAWEVSRLLGLHYVPPAALREVNGNEGSIQLWVEHARSETERIQANISHGDRAAVELLKQQMRIFDALVYNFDRNTGNILFDIFGRLWLVDHTRAFKAVGEMPEDLNIDTCERGLWAALRDLDAKELKKVMRPYLDSFQSAAILERLEILRGHLSTRIETLGEDAVLYDLPEGTPSAL